MKKTSLLLLAFITCLVTAAIASQLIDTTLKVTVRNDLGNIESGVTVSLYKSKEDFEKSINAVASQITDEKGNVVFKKLEAVAYYISAEKGDKNNYGAAEKTEPLLEQKQNKVTIIISE